MGDLGAILLLLVARRSAIRPFALLVMRTRIGFVFEQIGLSLRGCEAIGGGIAEGLFRVYWIIVRISFTD